MATGFAKLRLLSRHVSLTHFPPKYSQLCWRRCTCEKAAAAFTSHKVRSGQTEPKKTERNQIMFPNSRSNKLAANCVFDKVLNPPHIRACEQLSLSKILLSQPLIILMILFTCGGIQTGVFGALHNFHFCCSCHNLFEGCQCYQVGTLLHHLYSTSIVLNSIETTTKWSHSYVPQLEIQQGAGLLRWQ